MASNQPPRRKPLPFTKGQQVKLKRTGQQLKVHHVTPTHVICIDSSDPMHPHKVNIHPDELE